MRNENLYLNIINNLFEGVYFVDRQRKITFWNNAAENITGYSRDEIIGKYCQDNILNHIDKDGNQLCLHGCPLHKCIDDGLQRNDEVFLQHKNGYRVPVKISIFPFMENGEIIGAIEIFTRNAPVVYDEVLIERLSALAMNDQLTGLPNRRKLESYLDYRISEYKRFNIKFCTVFMDLDNFSTFNNKYGHKTGDDILRSVAQSIKYNMRNTDLFGRWGGEEFIGVFEAETCQEALRIAEKLRVLVEKSEVFYQGEKISITASLGVTLIHESDTIDTIIERADSLMYKSKQNNKNRVTCDC